MAKSKSKQQGGASIAEVAGRRMTLAGFQREHDEVERMVLEVTARKSQAVTNIKQQMKALDALMGKVEGLTVE